MYFSCVVFWDMNGVQMLQKIVLNMFTVNVDVCAVDAVGCQLHAGPNCLISCRVVLYHCIVAVLH